MRRLSIEISNEVACFMKDLWDTKKQVLNLKDLEHKRIIENIVANEKAYRARFG
jgi:hypothetical protein